MASKRRWLLSLGTTAVGLALITALTGGVAEMTGMVAGIPAAALGGASMLAITVGLTIAAALGAER